MPLAYAFVSQRSSLGIPTTQWSGLANTFAQSNTRASGWSYMLLGSALSYMPDDHVASNYITKWVEHNVDHTAQSIGYLPSDQEDWGVYCMGDRLNSPWMQGFNTLGYLFLNKHLDNADSNTVADLSIKFHKNLLDDPQKYTLNSYRMMITERSGQWQPGVNDFRSTPLPVCHPTAVTTRASDNKVIATAWKNGMEIAVNDPIYFSAQTEAPANCNVPAEVTEGDEYFVVSVNGFEMEISTTLGGSPINFNSDTSNCTIFTRPAIATTDPANFPPYLPNDNSVAAIAASAAIEGNYYDNTVILDSDITDLNSWTTNIVYDDILTWAYKEGQF